MGSVTKAPISDVAYTGTWTGTTDIRYSYLDDYPDTTPNDSITGGTADSNIVFGFNAFSLPATAANIIVYVDYYDQKSTSSTTAITSRLKVNNLMYDGTTHNAATSLTQRTDTHAVNPNTTLAWTYQDINGTSASPLQGFGIHGHDINPTTLFSCIQLRVVYNDHTTEGTDGLIGKVLGAIAKRFHIGNTSPAGNISKWEHTQIRKADYKRSISHG